MPRSGSSWVGDVLGNAPGAMYLREPLTQALLDANDRTGLSFRWFDESDPPTPYVDSVEMIANAIPGFNEKIVRNVDQWRLMGRRSKRVVVKEVNPFALPWLLETLSPTVIYLLRHPAAVAASFHKMGWSAAIEDRLPPDLTPETSGSDWVDAVRLQALVLRRNLDALETWSDSRIVLYEDLCVDPEIQFHELYDFADLTWTPALEMHVARRSSPDEIDDAPYTVNQPSSLMADAWRESVERADLDAMAMEWATHGIEYYGAKDWV